MRRKLFLSMLIFCLTALMPFGGIVTAQDNDGIGANDMGTPMTITINGLGKGEKADLSIYYETATEKALYSESFRNTSEKELIETISLNLKDGHYLLLLEVPDKYFRDPKGYFFNVSKSKIVNPRNLPIVFNLGPRSNMLEPINDLSAPLKVAPRLTRSNLYVGPWTGQDNTGVRGGFTVVDPGVDHSTDQFVAKRAMATNGSYWMEIGWAEAGWRSDTRYMYQYDSYENQWHWYALPTGASLEVRVMNSYGNYWVAQYYDSGDWYYVRGNNISFQTASTGDLQGEIYPDGGANPNLPACYNDVAELRVSGNWDLWDTTYATSTSNDGPYDTHYSSYYWDFYIHTH